MIVAFITFGLLVFHAPLASKTNDNELSVYRDVPGLNTSPFYQMKVRKEGSEGYRYPFTFVTECTAEKYCNTTGIYNHLANWSNCYINFEKQEGIDVEIVITKLFGDPIKKAVVHPYTAQRCVLPISFPEDIYCHSSKSTGKETGKMHLCALLQKIVL
jgi:hypothetical protein